MSTPHHIGDAGPDQPKAGHSSALWFLAALACLLIVSAVAHGTLAILNHFSK